MPPWVPPRRVLTAQTLLAATCVVLGALVVWLAVLALWPASTAHTPPAATAGLSTPGAASTAVVRVPQSGGPGGSATVTVKTQPAAAPPGTIASGAVGWTITADGRDPQLGTYAVSAKLVRVDPVSASAVAAPDGRAWVLVTVTLANQGATAYTPRLGDFTLTDASGHALGTPTSQPQLVPVSSALPLAAIPPGGSASGELLFAAPADTSAPLGIARGLWLAWRPAPATPAALFAWGVS